MSKDTVARTRAAANAWVAGITALLLISCGAERRGGAEFAELQSSEDKEAMLEKQRLVDERLSAQPDSINREALFLIQSGSGAVVAAGGVDNNDLLSFVDASLVTYTHRSGQVFENDWADEVEQRAGQTATDFCRRLARLTFSVNSMIHGCFQAVCKAHLCRKFNVCAGTQATLEEEVDTLCAPKTMNCDEISNGVCCVKCLE